MNKQPTFTYKEYLADKADELLKQHEEVLWGREHQEEVDGSDIHESIERALDDYLVDALPKEVILKAYHRMPIDPEDVDPDGILENAIERLQEEYGGPDWEDPVPTKKMKEAAEAFAKVIAEEFSPWMCVDFLSVVLDEDDIKEWIKVNG